MRSRNPGDIRLMASAEEKSLEGSNGTGRMPKGEIKNRKQDKGKGKNRKDSKEEMVIAKLTGLPDKAIKVIFQLLEPLSCTSVAFALTHPRLYKVRKAYFKPVKDLYCYDPPLMIRTPNQLLYVIIKQFMGSERHFCYTRRKFIPWSRQGMTIEEKRRDRCPEDATPKSCGLWCGDNVGPLSSD